MNFYKKSGKNYTDKYRTEVQTNGVPNALWYLDILYAFIYGLKVNCTTDLTLHTN